MKKNEKNVFLKIPCKKEDIFEVGDVPMHGIGTSGRSKVTALMSGNSEQLETYAYSIFCTEFLKKMLEAYSYFYESFFEEK